MKPHFRQKLEDRLELEEGYAISPMGQLTRLILDRPMIRISDIARVLDHEASSVTRWFSHTKNLGRSAERNREINNQIRKIVKAINMIPEDADLFGRADEVIEEHLELISD